MSTTHHPENPEKVFEDNILELTKFTERMAKLVCDIRKEIDEASPQVKAALAARSPTKREQTQRIRKNKYDSGRARKRPVSEEAITIAICAVKPDGKLVHYVEHAVADVDLPECCQHVFTHGGACQHFSPARPEQVETLKHASLALLPA